MANTQVTEEQRKQDGIRVRLTAPERAALEAAARAEGLTISDLARQRLGLSDDAQKRNQTQKR